MLLIGLLKSLWAKSHIGELLVRLFSHWQLDKQTYLCLHNITLSPPDGTTQMDNISLSSGRIFMLETKNMNVGISYTVYQPRRIALAEEYVGMSVFVYD